jgi:Uma2 family endonuclease
LGGRAFVEASVLTSAGVLVADVAWASDEFMQVRGFETPYNRAPELCIEVVSPSDSRKELSEKVAAYLEAGAEEVWIVFPQSKRCEFHGRQRLTQRSRYPVDLADIFS